MDIYHYHPTTKVFIRQSEARPDPKVSGRFLIPAFATAIEPPAVDSDFEPYFDGSEWQTRKIRTEQPSEYHTWDDQTGWSITEEDQAMLDADNRRNLEASLEAAVDSHINAVAQAKGYDNRVTCALRAGYSNPWQQEGIAFGTWMDLCYLQCQTLIAEIGTGEAEIPTEEELIASLPEMVWP